MPVQRGQQFPPTGVGNEWGQNSENISLASKNIPKTQTTPVRNMGKVGGSENTALRMTPAPLTGGGATIYRKLGDSEGYPRGHTPEQMREVRDVEASGMLRIKGEGVYTHSAKDEATMRESIARSKINPKETFTEPVEIKNTSAFIGARGLYTHKDEVERYPEGRHSIKITRSGEDLRKNADWPLIHEIGHYNDREAVKNRPYIGQAGVHEYAGKLEGTADSFARENLVEDPREVRKVKNKTPESSPYQAYAGLGQHASPKTDTSAWTKGYLSTGMETAKRGDSSYTELNSTVEIPGGERPGAKYSHPETKSPITGKALLDYMQGKD